MSAAVEPAHISFTHPGDSAAGQKKHNIFKEYVENNGGCESLIRFNKYRGRGHMSAAVTLHCWRKKPQ